MPTIARCLPLFAWALVAMVPLSGSAFGQEAKGGPEAGVPLVRTPAPSGVASGGNSWFSVTNRDLGTYFGQGDAVGVFPFKNPSDQPVEWRQLTGSCQCTKAIIRVGERTYELESKPTPNVLTRVTKVPGKPDQRERVQQITIEPQAEGEIEVHLDMNGITGPKQASLDIHTSDATLPHLKLNFHANGAQLFLVSPSEINLNKMTWSESREFTVTVTSPLHKEWKITRMEDAGKAFQVRWEPSVSNGVTSWVIHGTYGPVDGESGGGALLKFFTDVQGESSFTVRVVAFVQGPMEVKPGGFIPLGMVRKGTGATREIVFEPNDGFALATTSLAFDQLSLPGDFVTASSRKDGDKLIVELHVSDRAPVGMVKGDLVIGLNHPLIKEKRIMFNGFVR